MRNELGLYLLEKWIVLQLSDFLKESLNSAYFKNITSIITTKTTAHHDTTPTMFYSSHCFIICQPTFLWTNTLLFELKIWNFDSLVQKARFQSLTINCCCCFALHNLFFYLETQEVSCNYFTTKPWIHQSPHNCFTEISDLLRNCLYY